MLPIAHDHHGPIELPNFEFRLEDDLGFGRRLSRKEHGNWIDLYSFSETPVHAVDFLHDSYFLSTSPESHFVRQPGVSKVIEGGFLSALDATLKRRTGDEVVEEVIGSVEEWRDILSEHYGIELSAEDAARTFAPW